MQIQSYNKKNLFGKKQKILLLAICALVAGCSNTNTDNSVNKANHDTIASISTLDPTHSALIKVNNRLFNVPSPLQLAGMLKDFGMPYQNTILNGTEKKDRYTTSFKQSLNLGVYGADLGYINVFEQFSDAPSYFEAIRGLSTELGILNAFKENTFARIEQNSGNKDSLLYISSLIYRDSDSYLMNSERNETGALIIAGGWVEGMYLLTQTDDPTKMNTNQLQTIGMQKHPLNNLIELLRPYYGKLSDDYDLFLEKLSDIANIFDGISVKYEYKPSQTDEQTKTTIINSETFVEIGPQQVTAIADKIAKLREDITK